jgi:Uma2 family endonuclease
VQNDDFCPIVPAKFTRPLNWAFDFLLDIFFEFLYVTIEFKTDFEVIAMSETITSAQPRTKRPLLTYDDYLTFPDNDGIRKEIIEGELFMSPAPSIKHQSILRNLFRILDKFIVEKNLGEAFFAPCDVILSDINVIQPDILFISRQNYEIITALNIQGTPDLLIEIISPSTIENDRIFKKLVYEKFGVKEYWLVDPEQETIEGWTLKQGRFQLFQKAHKNEVFASKLIQGLELDLAPIFQ